MTPGPMAAALCRALATTTTPSPDPGRLRPGLTADQVSPGFGGFLAIFAVAVAAVFLFFGLTRQLRRMRHNVAEQDAERAGAAHAAGGADAVDVAGGCTAAPKEGSAEPDAADPGDRP